MLAVSRRQGFTFVELVLVIVVILIVLAVVLPAIQASREAARRAACTNNLKMLGVTLHNHHDVHKRFPASCGLPDGERQNGRSWLTGLVPYLQCGPSCSQLTEIRETAVPTEHTAPLAFQWEIRRFVCPSYSGPHFANPSANPPTGALTQYKALGATHHASLAQAPGGSGGVPGYPGNHPDGTLYPGSKTDIQSITDGTSYTVLVCETVEQRRAVWCQGKDATLVGLPPSVTYAKAPDPATYFAPTGFNGKYGDGGGTSQVATYLDWDYQNDGYYVDASYQKGPGSEHPRVVNHLFADGAVNSLSKDIDAALYFFLITRAGGDPAKECLAEIGAGALQWTPNSTAVYYQDN